MAKWARVTPKTIYRWIETGEIPVVKFGNRTYRVPARAIIKKLRLKEAEKQERARECEGLLVKYLLPVLGDLNQRIDRRLAKTFLGLVMVIINHRHRNHGLLLSELGGYLLGAEACCAGTKRIGNILHSEKWTAQQIEDFQWVQGTQCVERIEAEGERALVVARHKGQSP